MADVCDGVADVGRQGGELVLTGLPSRRLLDARGRRQHDKRDVTEIGEGLGLCERRGQRRLFCTLTGPPSRTVGEGEGLTARTTR